MQALTIHYILGHFVFVVNGVLVKDAIEPYFVGSNKIKPESLQSNYKDKVTWIVKSNFFVDNLVLLKFVLFNSWIKYENFVTNLNVFRYVRHIEGINKIIKNILGKVIDIKDKVKDIWKEINFKRKDENTDKYNRMCP